MKSRITIEVDFENGNMPVIQVLQQNSDDVRDNLIKSFLQSLQHSSRWCKIQYIGYRAVYNGGVQEIDNAHTWRIIPMRPQEIPDEMKLMDTVYAEWRGIPIKATKR